MARPRTITDEQRQQVIELKRRNSFSEVATLTGLPIGTVKTICRRSGALADNPKHRALFTLPSILQHGTATGLANIEIPEQVAHTSNKDLNAMMWLREVIKTGKPELIDYALANVGRVKTPPEELERLYSQHLMESTGNSLKAAFGSIGFASLDGLARSVRGDEISKVEFVGRFGREAMEWRYSPDLGQDHELNISPDTTTADLFCIKLLRDPIAALWAEYQDENGNLSTGYASHREAEQELVKRVFSEAKEYLPHTLSDCLYELAFWDDLYRLRNGAVGGENPLEANLRCDFVFSLLAEIRPRNKDEAKAVLRYLIDKERKDDQLSDSILENLLSA